MKRGMQMEKKNSTLLKRILALGLLAAALGVGGWYYYTAQQNQGIYDYSAATDRAFILDLFKKDWYWLISDYSPDYSPEHMLDAHAPSKEPEYTGSLIIKTYRVDNKPIGFVSYYPKELFEGYILFLAIGKEYRAKGLARKLMQYAIDDLKKKGMRVIRLITRVDNVRGRKLYTGLGFKQVWTDGAYVKYEKEVKS
jgi:ribosomal protein S18 acetylase RimI-like enzyme